jgi:hypothetical protein
MGKQVEELYEAADSQRLKLLSLQQRLPQVDVLDYL